MMRRKRARSQLLDVQIDVTRYRLPLVTNAVARLQTCNHPRHEGAYIWCALLNPSNTLLTTSIQTTLDVPLEVQTGINPRSLRLVSIGLLPCPE